MVISYQKIAALNCYTDEKARFCYYEERQLVLIY